ncbi:MAG TPA: hypothetical protein VL968_05600, partial [Rhodocyclaceae bacterium]|nr:hypothetical protein [Rhodocyclaceae bacterium]
KISKGELVHRIPHTLDDPVLNQIRINLNSALDQTETAFREILGGMKPLPRNATSAVCNPRVCMAPSRKCWFKCRSWWIK